MKKGKFKIIINNPLSIVEVSGYDQLAELPFACMSKEYSDRWIVYDKATGFKIGEGSNRANATANAILCIEAATKVHPYKWYQERTMSFYDFQFPLNEVNNA